MGIAATIPMTATPLGGGGVEMVTQNNETRKIVERFGGDRLLDPSIPIGIGYLNIDGGWVPSPWRFSRYTGVLRLSMTESRLGLEYLKHQWDCEQKVWANLDKLALLWGCNEKTLRKARRGLRDKGFLMPQDFYYKLRKYTVFSLLIATAICVVCDTDSDYAKEYGVVSLGNAETIARRYGFDLDFERMQRINEYQLQSQNGKNVRSETSER